MIFSTRSYAELGARVAELARLPIGAVETKLFADGERYLRLASDPAGRDAAVLGGTVSEADALELYDLACGVVEAGARSLTLVIPYFGYSTMERPTRANEIVTAKTRARLFSSIPVPGSGSRVLLLDLHTEGIPYYFEGGIRPVHVYAKPVILEAVRSIAAETLCRTRARNCLKGGSPERSVRMSSKFSNGPIASGTSRLSRGVATTHSFCRT